MNDREKQIIEKAFELFQNYGIKSVSMDDLSTHLGISKKTLYAFVPKKSILVKRVFDYGMEKYIQQFAGLFSDKLNAVEELVKIKQFFREIHKNHKPYMVYDLKKYYPEVYLSMQKQQRAMLLGFVKANLIKGKAENLYRKELDEEIIARLQIFRYENLVENDLFSIEEITSDKFVSELFIYHLHGILNENGVSWLKAYREKKQGCIYDNKLNIKE